MSEAWNSPASKIWGCDQNRGWVPYPPDMSRRHPLVDAVGRIDDPCARPAQELPDYAPTPKFKPPRQGYPNNICNIEDRILHESQIRIDYAAEKAEVDSGQEPGATVNVTVAPGTAHQICLRPEPILQMDTIYTNPPTIEDCCADARSLDTLKSEVNKILGPHEELEMGMKNWAQCQSSCHPLLPKYPCRGVIRSPRSDWLRMTPEQRCKPTMPSMETDSTEEYKPPTGREFVEGKQTSDLYEIHFNLPKRFNNAEWFKGYGAERPTHPFYTTTTMDYGRFPPTAHTMTLSYFPRHCAFTDHLGKAGMPRNRSLNLSNDKTIV